MLFRLSVALLLSLGLALLLAWGWSSSDDRVASGQLHTQPQTVSAVVQR